jgi:hypothetical protein
MGLMGEIKQRVEMLSPEQQAELREWLLERAAGRLAEPGADPDAYCIDYPVWWGCGTIVSALPADFDWQALADEPSPEPDVSGLLTQRTQGHARQSSALRRGRRARVVRSTG